MLNIYSSMQYLLFNIKENEIEIIEENDVLDKLYELEYRPITDDDVAKNKNKAISEIIKEDKDIVQTMKKQISQIENKIPLYDIYSNNIFLIDKYSVYERVTNQYYRFPDKELLDDLKKKEEKKVHILPDRMRKYDLMIMFMNYFDLDLLHKTYTNVFNKYSTFEGQEITACRKPSFLPQFYHIRPYYTRNELINMERNMGETKNVACKQVAENEMSFNVLLDHKKYMTTSKDLGLIQFYTLQGSSMMNQYLRNRTSYKNKNVYLENLISPMWKIILSAPALDKKYTLYRFIKNDDYIQNLKIGDMYTEPGFLSTTRDPFYKFDDKFGFILMKVNVPAGIQGVALCLETVSYFAEEQEVIFPPQSKFKLVKKDSDCVYYHTDENFTSKIKTRYEFDWVSNDPEIKFFREQEENKTNTIEFLKLERKFNLTLANKIKEFKKELNEADQFKIKLGDKEITVIAEWYDSSTVYKNFYAIETDNGFSIYSIYDSYILFFIEIGQVNSEAQMRINYYVKYSAIDPNKIIGDQNLILFYCQVAYFFDIHNIVIYANYLTCDAENSLSDKKQRTDNPKTVSNKNKTNSINNRLFGGSYCVDFYQYFTTNKKKYTELNVLNIELHPQFSYYDLDMLKTVSPQKILKRDDQEIYQLYNKVYKLTKNNDTVADFYIWLREGYCYLIDKFAAKIDRILGTNNPFRKDYYFLDPMSYLYNRHYIKTYPSKFKPISDAKRNII